MKKVTVEVMETLKYKREIEIEVPDEMTEQQLEFLFSKMERDEFLIDAVYVLKEAGIKVGRYDDDLDSPDYGEVEVIEFNFES